MKKSNKGKTYKPYKRMTNEEINLILLFHEQNVNLRQIANLLGRSLRAIQYQLKKHNKI